MNTNALYMEGATQGFYFVRHHNYRKFINKSLKQIIEDVQVYQPNTDSNAWVLGFANTIYTALLDDCFNYGYHLGSVFWNSESNIPKLIQIIYSINPNDIYAIILQFAPYILKENLTPPYLEELYLGFTSAIIAILGDKKEYKQTKALVNDK